APAPRGAVGVRGGAAPPARGPAAHHATAADRAQPAAVLEGAVLRAGLRGLRAPARALRGRALERDDIGSNPVVPTGAPKARSGGTSLQQAAANCGDKVPPLRRAALGSGRDDGIVQLITV